MTTGRPTAEVTRGQPVVEVTREVGGVELVESVHTGHVVVAGPDGAVRALVGDAGRPTFVRSSVKPFQATACLELLAEHAPEVALDDEELAVAWASHRGEQRHLDAVRRLLARSGTAPEDLTCPPALPEADRTWPPASPGEPPSRLRFNCSGKHALFALVGHALGVRGPAVLDPDGPVQRPVLAALEDAVGPLAGHGVDGCGAPAVVSTPAGLARGFRELAAGGRWAAARDAGLAHPGLVGGEGRPDTALLAAGVVAKVGAEGVLGAGFVGPDGPVGVAVKVDDGGDRAAAVATVAVLARLGVVAEDVWSPPPVTGGEGVVGRVRPAGVLAGRSLQ